jgi:hypothetical protein
MQNRGGLEQDVHKPATVALNRRPVKTLDRPAEAVENVENAEKLGLAGRLEGNVGGEN